MKLSIFEKNTIDETEVVVNCKQKNHEKAGKAHSFI